MLLAQLSSCEITCKRDVARLGSIISCTKRRPDARRYRTTYAGPSIDDYAERTKQTIAAWNGMNGRQTGDPAKLAAALMTVTQQEKPPLRWVAGADAIATVERKAKDLLAQVDAYRELSSNLAYDDA